MAKEPTTPAQPTVTTLPGDNVPRGPAQPWVPNTPPTGTPAPVPGPSTHLKPPGWFPIFFDVLKAYLANPNLSSQGVVDQFIVDRAEHMTDLLMARFPSQWRTDPATTPVPAPAPALRPFSK